MNGLDSINQGHSQRGVLSSKRNSVQNAYTFHPKSQLKSSLSNESQRKTFIFFSLLFFCFPVFAKLFAIERKLFTFLSLSLVPLKNSLFLRQAF